MMRTKAIIYFSTLSFILGCVTPVYQITTPYSDEEHRPYTQKGNSVIVGQAFLKTRGGDVKYGAGDNVYLLPRTAYTTECLEKLSRGEKLSNL